MCVCIGGCCLRDFKRSALNLSETIGRRTNSSFPVDLGLNEESIIDAPQFHLHHNKMVMGKTKRGVCLSQEANVSTGGPVGMWPL